MTVVKLVLDKDETREKQYIIDRVKLHSDFELEINDTNKFCVINIYSDSKCFKAVVKDIIYSVVCIFYKYDILVKEFNFENDLSAMHCAIIGAMLSFDGSEEYKKVSNCIDIGNTICIRSLFLFRLGKLVESWKGLVALVTRLISQCENNEDYYDLVFFLLAVEKDLAPKINFIIEDNNYKIYTDNILIPLPHFCSNDQLNALITIVRERPRVITIKGVEFLAPEIYGVIKELGKV